jgi:hypothetical protein
VKFEKDQFVTIAPFRKKGLPLCFSSDEQNSGCCKAINAKMCRMEGGRSRSPSNVVKNK